MRWDDVSDWRSSRRWRSPSRACATSDDTGATWQRRIDGGAAGTGAAGSGSAGTAARQRPARRAPRRAQRRGWDDRHPRGCAGSAGGGTTGGRAARPVATARWRRHGRGPVEPREAPRGRGGTARPGTPVAPGSGGRAGRGGTDGRRRAKVGQRGDQPGPQRHAARRRKVASAGTTGQGGQGNLPGGVTSLFPPPNGQNLCPDPPLKITFSGTPTLGSTGRFRVFSSGGSAVATVDMAAATITETIGGMAFTVSRPVYVDGNTVSVTLPPKALAYGQTYYVNVESGAITAAGGALSITDTTTWRFTTEAAAPSNRTAISVALDGIGQLLLRPGRVRLVPANNTAAGTITIAAGTYHEIIHLEREEQRSRCRARIATAR